MSPTQDLYRKLAILREEARHPEYTPAQRAAARAEAAELERKLREQEIDHRVDFQYHRIGRD